MMSVFFLKSVFVFSLSRIEIQKMLESKQTFNFTRPNALLCI